VSQYSSPWGSGSQGFGGFQFGGQMPFGSGQFNNFMQSNGYQRGQTGSGPMQYGVQHGQSGGWSRKGVGGNTYSMSEATANLMMQRQGPRMGGQAGQAAMGDFQQLSGILNQQNQQRAQYTGGLFDKMNQLDQTKQQMVAGFEPQAAEHAAELKGLADKNLGKFEDYRDRQEGKYDNYVSDTKAMVSKALNDFDENSMASVSAAASGMRGAAESQIQQIENQASAMGMNPQQTAAMTQKVRMDTTRQMQSSIAPMIDQLNQFKLSGSLQGAGIVQGAYGAGAQMGTQLAGQTSAALARHSAAYGAANQSMQAAKMQSVVAHNQFEQMQVAFGSQLAGALQGLTQKYPSMYDTIMQAGFGQQMFGNTPAFNFG